MRGSVAKSSARCSDMSRIGKHPVAVPGGVTLPPIDGEDAGQVQSLNARFSRDLVTLDYAQTMGCRACGSSGGGCQFLGTAATSQVVAEGFGLALPHSALSPSGEPAWTELGRRSATALVRLHGLGISIDKILTQRSLENAMLVHAAFGGSTNLLLHIPAIARQAGLTPPTVDDWSRINRSTPRLVDALPNGPRGHPTVQVFMAGGVPEALRTFVAVPTMLTSDAGVRQSVLQLEVHYLANPAGDVRFALLSDWADADAETMPGDERLLAIASQGIAALNRRYGATTKKSG